METRRHLAACAQFHSDAMDGWRLAQADPDVNQVLRWTSEAVWRELPSGGRVFASGTFYWGWALDPAFGEAAMVGEGQRGPEIGSR